MPRKEAKRHSQVAQWVKDLTLSLLQLGSYCGKGSIPGLWELPHAEDAAKK